MAPVSSLLTMGQSIQEMRTSMERVEDVMNYAPDVVSAWMKIRLVNWQNFFSQVMGK